MQHGFAAAHSIPLDLVALPKPIMLINGCAILSSTVAHNAKVVIRLLSQIQVMSVYVTAISDYNLDLANCWLYKHEVPGEFRNY